MARSAKQDVFEKFRFRVVNINVENSPLNNVDSQQSDNFSAGFSEVTVPEARVTERKYRENIDPLTYIKSPGLVNYEPIVLRKGKTKDRSFYNWYKKVNNDASAQGFYNELLSSQNFIPVHNVDFRKDIAIGLYDRQGTILKAWFVFNSFPIGYKGGDDLNAADDAKLIEEITLSYETVIELNEDSINGIRQEVDLAAEDALRAAALSSATNLGLPF